MEECRELLGGGDGEAGQSFFEPNPGIHAELLTGGGEDRQQTRRHFTVWTRLGRLDVRASWSVGLSFDGSPQNE